MERAYKTVFIAFIFAFTGCGVFRSSLVSTSSGTTLISADRNLDVSILLSAAGQTPALGGQVPTNGILALPAPGGITPADPGGPGGSGISISGSIPPSQGSGYLGFDATSPYAANLLVSNVTSHLGISGCAAFSPYSSVNCLFPSFQVNSLSLSTAGTFQIGALTSAGISPSNGLPVSNYYIRQVSNSTGSPITNDTSAFDRPGVVYDGLLYWDLNNSNDVDKLYSYDGTNLTQISNIVNNNTFADSVNGFGGPMTICNGFLDIMTGGGSWNFYTYDGTTLTQVSGNGTYGGLTCFNNQIYFIGPNSGPFYNKLTLYNGTSFTIESNSNTTGNDTNGGQSAILFQANGTLYYVGQDSSNHGKVFSFDGVTLKQVSDVNTGNNDSNVQLGDTPGAAQIASSNNGKIYFVLNNTIATTKLYQYDGTSVTQISNTNPGSSDFPSDLFSWNGNLYFSATNGTTTPLFKYDGTTLSEINSNGSVVGAYGSNLMISGSNGTTNKLFGYNGQSLTQITNTSGSQSTQDAVNSLINTVYNGKFYFSANNPSGVKKLFVYDGHGVSQISNTSGSSGTNDSPNNLIVYNNKLYFTSVSSGGGRKLFSICDISTGCAP